MTLRRGVLLLLLAGWSACSDDEAGLDPYFGSNRYQTIATGRFRTEKVGERFWLITPDGHPFFSSGVNVVSFAGDVTRDGKHPYQETTQAKYGSPEAWRDAQLQRLPAWGWNTIGAWSDVKLFQGRFPYTVAVNVSDGNAPVLDFFAPAFQQRVEERLQEAVPRFREDPYLIGFFFDNEMHWSTDHRGGHLFDAYLAFSAQDSPGKRRLMDYLQQRYGSVAALAADFEANADSWEALGQTEQLLARDTEGARRTRAEWTGLVAEEYFRRIQETFRRLDPSHLNLGSRFVGQLTPRAVVVAAGRHVDVISVNFYAMALGVGEQLNKLDPDNLPVAEDLREHFQAGGKPVLLSEWGLRADDAGLANSVPLFFETFPTQAERVQAFEQRLRDLFQLPWLVGQHWFQLVDQPAEGRHDGENNNWGLLTIADEPYTALVERATALLPTVYDQLP